MTIITTHQLETESLKHANLKSHIFISDKAIQIEGSKFLIMGWEKGQKNMSNFEGGFIEGPYAYLIKVSQENDADIVNNGEILEVQGTLYKIHNENKWKEWELEKVWEPVNNPAEGQK
jgi:hypothetical protein